MRTTISLCSPSSVAWYAILRMVMRAVRSRMPWSITAVSTIWAPCRARIAPVSCIVLDRDTSGLMLAAKDDDTQRALQNLIRTRTLDRRYITLVHGHIAMDEGTINTGIARSTRDRVKMAVSDDSFRAPGHYDL